MRRFRSKKTPRICTFHEDPLGDEGGCSSPSAPPSPGYAPEPTAVPTIFSFHTAMKEFLHGLSGRKQQQSVLIQTLVSASLFGGVGSNPTAATNVVYVSEWFEAQVNLPKYAPALARKVTTPFQTSESKLFSSHQISTFNSLSCYVRKAAAFIV